jgi:hypothetical protein
MTEKLRYVGKPTAEFETDEVYSLIIGIHQGFYEVKTAGGHPHKYASLAMLLKFWQPPG